MFRMKKGIIIYDKIILTNNPEKRTGIPGFAPGGAHVLDTEPMLSVQRIPGNSDDDVKGQKNSA